MLYRNQANAIYRAYKNGHVNVSKHFISAMYKMVGLSDYAARHESEFAQNVARKAGTAALYILDHDGSVADEERGYELAQAVIDGKQVEQVKRTVVEREFEVTQDVLDNPEAYGIGEFEVLFYGLGDTYTEENTYIDYEIR